MIAQAKPDKVTQRWMRDASDEYAVYNGCWFDEARGQFVVDWFKDYLRFYEGEWAGRPFELEVARGGMEWQYEFIMRLFGWVRESAEWGRVIRRFRKASFWAPKKSGKSPLLAGVCVYHAFGDGVSGQKCFPTAVDGAQIRENVGRHIFEMVRQSEELASECTLNKTHCSVFHEPTRSLIMPLSSDNVQTQKSKEGLNGSIFVDETHVVSKPHMRRISRAGISRPEPLLLECSTAGDEPESYGMERFNYAEGVISGNIKDDQTLAVIYAAPQDVTDEQIHADPLRYGKLANPSMGHTIKQSEFLSDYQESKATISGFADFKKYRLNIWQQSSNPWLSIHDWAACPGTEFPLDQFAPTFAGLDLSRTTDLTAWILFQPGDTPKCVGHYWIPKQRAIDLSGQFEIPLLDWAEQGWVTLTEDRIIDREQIHTHLRADAEHFHELKYVAFDPYNADDTVKFCANELDWVMVETRQGAGTLNAPSKALEEMVISLSLDHSNDPVLAWMLKNVSVKIDENGNIKPIKTVGGIRKHIDGIVSLIMAIHASMCNPIQGPSIYETPGMLTL
jgi:phage terminase large subunit-like protein